MGKNRKDMAIEIAEEYNISFSVAMQIIDNVFNQISASIASDGRVELRNFGIFTVNLKKPRKARNPRTGETVNVPARHYVKFKPGKEMIQKVVENQRLIQND